MKFVQGEIPVSKELRSRKKSPKYIINLRYRIYVTELRYGITLQLYDREMSQEYVEK